MASKFLPTLGLIGFLGVVGLVGEWETHYTRLATCTNIQYDTRIAKFIDNDGNMWKWEIEPTESFEIGNVYRLHMSDNHSTSIYDDYIRKIKKY
jgi:hypothetical protein